MGIFKLRGLGTASMVAFVCGLGALGPAAGPAFADNTIVVNTTQTTYTQGDGLCALGEAVDYANGGSDPDCSATPRSGTTTIKLPAGDLEVPGAELDLPTNVVGAGASQTALDGGGIEQVVNVDSSATVTLSNLAITGGMSGPPPACTPVVGTPCGGQDGGDGGGIMNLGKLTLNEVTVSGNQTTAGSEGSYEPQHICFDCLVVPSLDGGNGGSGGGIYNAGGATLTVDDSTITGNRTGAGAPGTEGFAGSGTNAGPGIDGGAGGDGGYGAGIYNAQNATLTLTNSTVSDNATGAGGAGGPGSDATYDPSTGGNSGESGNGGDGAGINDLGVLSVAGSTFAGNTTGAGGDGSTAGSDDGNSGTGTVLRPAREVPVSRW